VDICVLQSLVAVQLLQLRHLTGDGGWTYRDIATCERWKTADMLSDGTINVTVHHSDYLQNYAWNSCNISDACGRR